MWLEGIIAVVSILTGSCVVVHSASYSIQTWLSEQMKDLPSLQKQPPLVSFSQVRCTCNWAGPWKGTIAVVLRHHYESDRVVCFVPWLWKCASCGVVSAEVSPPAFEIWPQVPQPNAAESGKEDLCFCRLLVQSVGLRCMCASPWWASVNRRNTANDWCHFGIRKWFKNTVRNKTLCHRSRLLTYSCF